MRLLLPRAAAPDISTLVTYMAITDVRSLGAVSYRDLAIALRTVPARIQGTRADLRPPSPPFQQTRAAAAGDVTPAGSETPIPEIDDR